MTLRREARVVPASSVGTALKFRQATLLVIVFTVFIDMVGTGIALPILPRLIEGMMSGAASRASVFYGALVGIYCLMNFIASPMLGALSDSVGRRPVILISLAALGIDYVILALAPNLWWLVAARVLAGAARLRTASTSPSIRASSWTKRRPTSSR